MKKISDGLIENNFLGDCKNTVFTSLMEESFISPTISHLRDFYYVHGLLLYPHWTPTSDIFQFINLDSLELIKKKKCFFIFDASTEGFSPTKQFPFFDMLYYNCAKYNIDPRMIIYVSANLTDKTNIENYCKEKNLVSINVFCFLSFEKAVGKPLSLQMVKENTKKFFTNKYFSSLSRVNRQFRTMATFLLCQSEVAEKALISHDKFENITDLNLWKKFHFLNDVDDDTLNSWLQKLPLTIDKNDFTINWALEEDYGIIHHQTLFQIVNETLIEDYNKTSLFYSEKTFRPILFYQPFLIYGQVNCNKSLENYGYKNYKKWFDLDFDSEPDPVIRYKKLLKSVSETCRYLDSLSKDQQIEWRFSHEEILTYNHNTMRLSSHARSNILTFLENLPYETNQ